jgi:hypothetical protein
MRLLWPVFLIFAGTALVLGAVGLSERCSEWTDLWRGRSSESTGEPGDRSKAMSTRIMTVVFRLVGMYVLLAAAIGLLGIFLTR